MVLLSAIFLSLSLCQAEPAPPAALPPTPVPSPTPAQEAPAEEEPLPFRFGLALGPAWRPGESRTGSPKTSGYVLNAAFAYRYLQLGIVDLEVGFQFTHQVFWKCASWSRLLPGAPGGGSCLGRTLVRHGDFMALQTGTLDLGAWRPQVALAGGITLAEMLMPDSNDRPAAQTTRPVLRVALSLERRLSPELGLALELAHTILFFGPRRPVDGRSRPLFPDRQALSLWVTYTPEL
jgi:hypothetical protein